MVEDGATMFDEMSRDIVSTFDRGFLTLLESVSSNMTDFDAPSVPLFLAVLATSTGTNAFSGAEVVIRDEAGGPKSPEEICAIVDEGVLPTATTVACCGTMCD